MEAVQAAINKVNQALPRLSQMEIVVKVYDHWRGMEWHDPHYIDELVKWSFESRNRKVKT
jgi:hypothetical protein